MLRLREQSAVLGQDLDRLLRQGTRDSTKMLEGKGALAVFIVCGGFYGAVMATFAFTSERALLVLFGALKVPILFGSTMLLAVPSFYVLSALRGVGQDFPKVLTLLKNYQLFVVIVLAALAPITALINASTTTGAYQAVQFWNSLAFLLAAVLAQLKFSSQARRLVEKDERHRLLLRIWTIIYAFIGIQMAWTLRPFIGSPDQAIGFFREGKLDNAYVRIFEIFMELLGSLG